MHVLTEKQKEALRQTKKGLDPITLSEEIETKLSEIFELIHETEEQRAQEEEWLNETEVGVATFNDSVPATVANAPSAFTPIIERRKP